jgi:hypothetical protein
MLPTQSKKDIKTTKSTSFKSNHKIKPTCICDLDQTLFYNTVATRVLQAIAHKIFELSILLQKPNKELLEKIKNEYDDIVIVTSRSDEELRTITLKQVALWKIPYTKLIMFPSKSAKKDGSVILF